MNPNEYCILVAEDDALIRYTTARTLSAQGYRVIEAKDGQNAVERAAKYDGAIHVLITNVRMPNMDGHELARRVKAMIPGVKVLIISAHHEKDFPPEAHSHDFALLKPVMAESVLAKVADLLQQHGDAAATGK